MASVTLRTDRFPAGTSVSAYTRSDFPVMPEPPSGVPSGPVAVSTASVGTDGSLVFTGLADNAKYVAYAQVSGQDRYVQFRTPPLVVGSTSGTLPISATVYDASGNLTSITQGGVTTTYTYNADGSVGTSADSSTGKTTTYFWNADGTLDHTTVA